MGNLLQASTSEILMMAILVLNFTSDDAVGLCCLGILQLVILGVESKRAVPDWMLRLANDRIAWDKYPWGSYVWPTLYSQIRNAIVKRWSPLDLDIGVLPVTATTFFDRYNRYLVLRWNKKKEGFLGAMAIRFFGNAGAVGHLYCKPGNIIADDSYYSFGRVPSHMGWQNLQTTIETHDDVAAIFDQVRRGNYVNLQDFLNAPHEIYLDCYMRGYIVPVSFWQQLVPHFCRPDMHRLPYDTPIGWLSGEHMNSWMELCIRRRHANDNWTVAYTSTISVHPENNRFIIPTDQHVIGTLDGTTRPYPAWNDVDW
ncbi:hypothetical protein Tco_0526557 [Tanacetum coccineum]